MGTFEELSLLVSLLAILVSVESLRRTRVLAARQLELEEIGAKLAAKQLSIIEARENQDNFAKLDVEFSEDDGDYELVIRNVGRAEARDINFSYDGNGSPFVSEEISKAFPLRSLRGGKAFRLGAYFDKGSSREYVIDIWWTNPDGTQSRDNVIARW